MKTKLVMVMILMSNFAMAGGLDKVNTLMQKVSTALQALSLATITVAILWVGYKVLFTGTSIRDMGSTILGAVIIASAAQIAALLV